MSLRGVEIVSAHQAIRQQMAALQVASSAVKAVSKLFDTDDPNPSVYNLLTNELALLSSSPDRATDVNAVAFRLKLLVTYGVTPRLGGCSSCDARVAEYFSPAVGGSVCQSCHDTGSFEFSSVDQEFILNVLEQPLSEGPNAADVVTLRRADRVVSSTVEYHANIRIGTAFSL